MWEKQKDLYSPDFLQTSDLASSSQVLGLQACGSMPRSTDGKNRMNHDGWAPNTIEYT